VNLLKLKLTEPKLEVVKSDFQRKKERFENLQLTSTISLEFDFSSSFLL